MDPEIIKIWKFLIEVGGIFTEIQERASASLNKEEDPDFSLDFKIKVFVEQLSSVLDQVAFYLSKSKGKHIYFPMGKDPKEFENKLNEFDSGYISPTELKDLFETVQSYKTPYVNHVRILANIYKHRFVKILFYEQKRVFHEDLFKKLGGRKGYTPIIIGSLAHKLEGQSVEGEYFLQRDFIFDTTDPELKGIQVSLFADIQEAYELIHALVVNLFEKKYGIGPNWNDLNPTANKVYQGIVVEESLERLSALDNLRTLKVDVSDDINPNDRWHMRTIQVTHGQIKWLSQFIKPSGWYAHFWDTEGNIIVIFRDRVFPIRGDNKKTWEHAIEHGKSVGVPREQLDFQIP